MAHGSLLVARQCVPTLFPEPLIKPNQPSSSDQTIFAGVCYTTLHRGATRYLILIYAVGQEKVDIYLIIIIIFLVDKNGAYNIR